MTPLEAARDGEIGCMWERREYRQRIRAKQIANVRAELVRQRYRATAIEQHIEKGSK